MFGILCIISFILSGCTKDEILDKYNNMVEIAGTTELTSNRTLIGEREKGIDDYTGTYTATYSDVSATEYLFGGTTIERKAGKDITVTCTLTVTNGTAKVFWRSGSDESVILIETTGAYSEDITLP